MKTQIVEKKNVEQEKTVLLSSVETLDELTSKLEVQGCTKISINFRANRVSVGYRQNGHNYGARGNTLTEAMTAAVQLLQTPFYEPF